MMGSWILVGGKGRRKKGGGGVEARERGWITAELGIEVGGRGLEVGGRGVGDGGGGCLV